MTFLFYIEIKYSINMRKYKQNLDKNNNLKKERNYGWFDLINYLS